MALHVEAGQFDTDSKALDDEDDAGELDGDNVGGAPAVGVDEVGGMGTEDDTAEGGNGGLANVHALLDEGGAQHEQRGKAAENDVDQMGVCDIEVRPRHGEGRWSVCPRILRVVFGSSSTGGARAE